MKKLIGAIMLIQCGFMMAQSETVVTVNGKKVQVDLNALNAADNGLTAITAEGKVQLGGDLLHTTTIATTSAATLALKQLQDGANTDKILVADASGVLKWATAASTIKSNQVQSDWNQTSTTEASFIKNKPTIPEVPNLVPDDIGTVIVIDGKLMVAQEITAQMGADFTKTYTSTADAATIYPIGNITDVIIDNKHKFTSSATNNSFSVVEDGIYQVTINVQLSSINNALTGKNVTVVGIVDNSTGKWIARVNDAITDPNRAQTFTLITSAQMFAGHTYTFGTANNYTTTLYAFSEGSTGKGPVSFFSVKRLK